MIILNKKTVLFLLLILTSFPIFGQSGQINIRFIGNCGLHLSDGKADLYIDFPYKSGAFRYMKYESSEIDSIRNNAFFLFTHRHPDHYSKKIVRRLKHRRHAKVFGCWNTGSFEKLNSAIPDFKIEFFRTKHRFSTKHYSYLITWHDKRIFLSGDTETADTIATVKNIQWAFVPYWIMLDAREKNLSLDAEKIGIYHLYPNQTGKISNPDKIKLINKQGEIIQIPY